MLSEEISDDEVLFRAVPNDPDFWKHKEQRYSSAAFKQSGGTSVDRDGGRSKAEIINRFAERMPSYGLVSLTAQTCRRCNCHIISKPVKADPSKGIEENPYHAEIHDSENKVDVRGSKARRLSTQAETIVLTDVAKRSQQLWLTENTEAGQPSPTD